MNRHQVLTGACNAGDQCYAVGSVEGIHFTAYAAGCDIVILASDFQRVQIIPGVAHGNVKVSCVDCSTDTGKIAASYQRRVYIFEPTPLLHHESSHKLDYRWYQTAVFEADCFINCLSWNLEGFRLLTGGEVIQIWTYSQEHHDDAGGSKSVRFQVGEEDSERKLSDQGQGHPLQGQGHPIQGQDNQHLQDLETVWDCIWRCKPATAVYHLKYSPDGLLFASAGKADRLVKIWYEDRKIQLPLTRIDSVASPKKEELHYSFVYIAHPRAVTGFSWRKTSKYMPRGSVANMLITSCVDNVCRLWCETILPDDGLVDLEQFDPNASMEPKFHTHRHKKRFIQRLKTIRHAIHKRKKHHKFGPETVMSVPHLNSMASVHDFHKSSLHNNGVAPALHFHLAASINPETDIPLLPVVGAKGENQFNFQLHWLNNKELEFTMEAEIILQELHHGTLGGEEGQEGHHYDNHHDGSDSDHHQEQPETEVGTHYKKKKSKRFKRLHKHSRTHAHRRDSETSNGSDRSDHTSDGISNTPDVPGSVIDALDRKIEVLLKDWHQNPDMMFSIHPVDGSYLVWLVDWLDEYNPYCFRQAQVSFSSRLPHAFPVPDARTMASNLLMYCNYSKMDIKSAMKITETNSPDTTKVQNQPAPATGKSSPGQNDNMLIPNVLLISKHLNGSLNQWQISFSDNSKFSTVVSVAHASRACGHRFRTNNATCHPVLPLLLTTSHHNIPNDSSRSSPTDGSDQGIQMTSSQRSEGSNQSEGEAPVGGVEFCSELILWRVDPVGPLSKSGGIVELARINSPQVSAFSNVAWVPTLLPSSTLGSFSNSPSALFVASDGDSLRLYQAVIDARTLLQEIGPQKKDPTMSFCSNTSSGYSADVPKPPSDLFNIVSVQSSARPGCIIELETIAEASQTWHQIQLLHVFQEQLITGHPSCSPSDMEAIVDLRNSGSFSQNFYLVVLEKLRDHGSVLHMWKITISSQSTIPEEDMTRTYVPDIQLIQDDGSNPASRSGTPDPTPQRPTAVVKLLFSSSKVYSERLSLPDGVDISTATVAAGHLSSASIYPACLAPYSLVTACSDGDLRFWKCDVSSVKAAHGSCMDHSISTTSFEVGVEEEDGVRRPLTSVFTKCEVVDTTYKWEEWSMINQGQNTSAINVPGQPITVSCAYSGRLAVAYRLFGVRVMPDNPHGKLVNLWVAIYECESTGGAEWVLEDTIELKNVSIPDPKAEIDLNCIFSPQNDGLSPRNQSDDGESPAKGLSPSASLVNINRTKSVPSLSTICSVRKCISEFGNKSGLLKQKHLVQLDWVSTEDGSHILTVGVGSKVLMYAQVSNDVVCASKRTVSDSSDHDYSTASFHSNRSKGNLSLHLGEGVVNKARPTSHRRVRMQKSKSMVIDDTPEEVQWMKLRSIELTTADGLPPLPMHISWVRAGILVVGMDNEMHVYSQWRNSVTNTDSDDDSDSDDNRRFDDANLQVPPRNLNRLTTMKTLSSLKPSFSMPSLKHLQPTGKRASDGNLGTSKLNGSSESLTSLTAIHDFGLFEASRQANPVLPQYHPKKLMELLNFGKIRRVKAILAHLVRCIAGGEIHPAYFTEDAERDDSKWGLSRPRTVSVSGASPNDVLLQDEPEPDYKEISSIPPLPMYALLAADEDTTVAKNDHISSAGQQNAAANNDYSDLFSTSIIQDDDLDVNILGTSADSNRSGRQRVLSSTGGQANINPNYFGPGHSQMMTKHLTHTQLPGLSSLDQMYLLAIADTVASIKMDFADRFDSEKSGLSSTESQGTVQANETIDDCGLRFLLAMQHHIYLFRTLQPRQRAILSKQGLRSFNLVWAFHSEATEELLSHIPSMQRGEPQWEELRQFGVGWWINNINILKRTFEKVAKAAFQKKKDPMDAALFYLAMKKKNVLWGLYRSVENKRMMDFFKHDFTQERWRRAALKNAFDLLGKQRFEHAAAFFLLAGSLDDAIEVCMDKLGDMQLALVICRLYSDTDMMPDSVRKILYTQVLGRDEDGKNYNPDYCSPDPFLRSMALWLFKDYRGSLKTLLHTSEKRKRKVEDHNELEGHNTLPSVFNFYNYLRTHPLLIRERISKAAPNKKNTSVIPGFTRQQTIVSDSAVFVDKVTPMERRLFFKTAHTHFRNGCPLLALEVLSKLPPMTDHEEEDLCEEGEPLEEKCIQTGKLDENSSQNKGDVTDWSQPITNGLGDTNSFNAFDWSTPISSQGKSQSDAFDWSTPSRNFLDEEEPKFQLSSSESENSEDEQNNVEKKEQKKAPKLQKIPTIVLSDEEEDDRRVLFDAESKQSQHKSSSEGGVDIFAQQYKFIACLKVLMEEMRTLATGFEVDGGQLRFQLYIWLEKEVEVLQYLCHYNEELYPDNQDAPPPRNERTFDETDEEGGNTLDVTPRVNRSLSVRSDSSMVSYKPTLHEVILAEKMDFEAKLERMAKRKQWLRTHHQLVRTLASYCMLNGYGGGGLASVQMELLLLLQELQQEKPQQQLLTPLPFPTTLPLLSASIASSKTVVADPIQHIQCMAQDVLHSVIELTTPPSIATPFNSVLVMRDLSIALSSCVYQCLCDCDSFVVSLNENTDASLEGFTGYNFTKTQAGYLMAGVQKHRRKSNAGDEVVNTSPIKWPGVTSLRVLLAREKDEDAPKLSILMCETLVAVYISLLVNGLATYDCHMLYRLVAHRFDQQMWSALFGGGVKTILKVANSNTPPRSGDDVSKQRMRFNMKAMGQAPSSSKEKKTYKETFVPPELSMVTFFMTKPFPSSDAHFSYDSEESLSSEEEDEDSEDELTRPNTLPLSAVQQHTDPTSYSWSLIRYTVVKLVLHNLNTFLPIVGVELQELPVCSPLIHAVMKTLEQWSEILHSKLDLFAGPPEEFISGLQFDVTNGAPNTKVHALLNHSNSPFIDNHSTLPIKRLWFHLIRQEPVKEVFLRHIFRRRKEPMQDSTDSSLTNSEGSTTYKEPMKIIHKEQDLITAFALNQANANCLALSTQKEVVEIDISPILSPPNWLEDENELDIEHIKNPNPSSSTDSVDFYVVQTPVDGVQQQSNYTSGVSSPQTGTNTPIHSPMSQTGRGTNIGKGIHIPGITNPQVSHRIYDRSKRLLRMILRRPVPGVRRIGSHPSLPHYLTGSADGSVRLYEWGHMQPLAMLRQPGAFPKVTKVLFSVHGNKCCVSDTEGDICLWQVGIGTNFNKPIMSLKCHNKTTSDFAFVGSSSLIATAGHSSESKNVCLWDTLLPQRSACVHAFTCHEHGCPAVVYAPHHQLLISGGRKGEVCIFDIRQRQLRHTFQAHDVPIRCLAMDPEEEYFVTGSSEGDIKVWGLDVHQLVVNFPGEHSKNTFFRNMGSASGVTQVAIGTGHHLFSCGVDGSMKFRSLPERESMVRYWTV